MLDPDFIGVKLVLLFLIAFKQGLKIRSCLLSRLNQLFLILINRVLAKQSLVIINPELFNHAFCLSSFIPMCCKTL